jgi:hypothetical protein
MSSPPYHVRATKLQLLPTARDNQSCSPADFVRIFALVVLYLKIAVYLLSQYRCTMLPFANELKDEFPLKVQTR